MDPNKIRENWLNFLSKDAKSFVYLYEQTQYLRYLKNKTDSPAMLLVKEQIYREALEGMEYLLHKLLSRIEEYHLNNDIKQWEKLSE